MQSQPQKNFENAISITPLSTMCERLRIFEKRFKIEAQPRPPFMKLIFLYNKIFNLKMNFNGFALFNLLWSISRFKRS